MATRTVSNQAKAKIKPLRDRKAIKQLLLNALRAEFPNDTVDVSDGYQENIHVLVVSRSFDKMSEKQKQDRLWNVIEQTNLIAQEKALISLVYPVSVAELK